MREIKFRAWDKTSNLMRNDISSIDYKSDGTIAQINVISGVDILFPDKETELMQYTGLKDKNGLEIYEGDIVRKPADVWIGRKVVARKGEHDAAVVEWVDGSFRLNKYGNKSKNYYGVLAYTLNNEPSQLEVIGNIYENPELLEEPTHE